MFKKLLPNQYLLGQHLNGLRASRPLRHTFIKLKNLLVQRKQEIRVRAHLAQSVPVVELVRRIMDTFYLFYAIDVFQVPFFYVVFGLFQGGQAFLVEVEDLGFFILEFCVGYFFAVVFLHCLFHCFLELLPNHIFAILQIVHLREHLSLESPSIADVNSVSLGRRFSLSQISLKLFRIYLNRFLAFLS